MRPTLGLALAGVALALTAACSSTAQEQDAPRQPSITEQQQAVGAPVAQGYTLRVPSIGVDTPLVRLGLNTDGSVQVPDLAHVETAGYYDRGPKPGDVGPSVILGHINGGGRPGVFARLASLRPGDVVDTVTPTGTVRFTVYDTATVKKADFPTARVYGDRPGPELVLITCGPGELDSTRSNYIDQTLVFARATP